MLSDSSSSVQLAAPLLATDDDHKELPADAAPPLPCFVPTLRELHGHRQRINAAEFNADGTRVASGSSDGTVRVWSVAAQQLLHELVCDEKHPVWVVAWSPDGRQLLSSSGKEDGPGTVLLWSTETGQRVLQLPSADQTRAVLWTADGRYMVGCAESCITVYRAGTDEVVATHPAARLRAACLAGRRRDRLAYSSWDDGLRVIDLISGDVLHQLSDSKWFAAVCAVEPEADRIVACSDAVHVYSVATGELIYQVDGHENPVGSAAVDPAGRYLYTMGLDLELKQWLVATGELARVFKQPPDPPDGYDPERVIPVRISSDGTTLATSSCYTEDTSNTLEIWRLDSQRKPLVFDTGPGSSTAVTVSRSGARAVSVGATAKSIQLFDATTGVTQTRAPPNAAEILSLAVDWSGERVLVAEQHHAPQITGWESGAVQCTCDFKAEDGRAPVSYGGAFSPDGRVVVCLMQQHGAIAFDAETGSQLWHRPCRDNMVQYVSFSDDSVHVAFSDGRNTAVVCQTSDGEVRWSVGEHGDFVHCAKFTHSGGYLVTGCADGRVRAWWLNEQKTAELVMTLDAHTASVVGLVVLDEAPIVVSCSYDSSISVFDLTTRQRIRTLKLPDMPNSIGAAGRHVYVQLFTRSLWLLDSTPLRSADVSGYGVLHTVLESVRGASLAVIDRALADKVPVLTYATLPDGPFLDAAADASRCDELQALLRQKLPEQPRFRWSDVLLTAVRSGSLRAVGLVVGKLIESAKNANAVALVSGQTSAWRLFRPHDDTGMCEAMCQMSCRAPSELRRLLTALPLFAARPEVMYGFGNKAVLPPVTQMRVRPSSEHGPPGFWSAPLAGDKGVGDADEEEDDAVLIEAAVHPFPGLAGVHSGFLAALVEQGDAELFGNVTVRSLIEFKWTAYGRGRFLKQLAWYMLSLLVIMTIGFVVADFDDSIVDLLDRAVDGRAVASIAAVGVLALLTLRDASYEIEQLLRSGKRDYFGDAWNYMDMLQVALSAGVVVGFVVGFADALLLVALLSFVKWFGLLFYMQPFRATGPLVRMVLQIIADMRTFMLVLGVAVMAVGSSFFFLLQDEAAAADDGFHDPADALFTMFRLLLLVDFDVGTLAVGDYRLAIIVMFTLAMVLVPIVLLNLLIALMSDSYERIQDRARIEFQLLRARILLEMELFMSEEEKRREEWFPRFLQVLVPQGAVQDPEAGAGEEWQGVLHALKQGQELRQDELEDQMNAKFSATQLSMKEQFKAVDVRLARMEDSLARVLQAVKEVKE